MLPLPAGGAPHLFLLMAIAALIGGLSAIERKGAFQLMLSRPIVLAPLLGWALGDAQGGLVLGIPLELLFLGGVNLGGSLPDNESLLAGALTAIAIPAGMAAGTGVDAPLAAMGLALVFPLALFGRQLERAAELRNAQLMEDAITRAARGDPRLGARLSALAVPPGIVEPARDAERRVRRRHRPGAQRALSRPGRPRESARPPSRILQLPPVSRRGHPRRRGAAGRAGG